MTYPPDLIVDRYVLSDNDITGSTKYSGYMDREGNYYILKNDTTTGTFRYYRKDDGGVTYAASWTGRAGLTYSYFHEVF